MGIQILQPLTILSHIPMRSPGQPPKMPTGGRLHRRTPATRGRCPSRTPPACRGARAPRTGPRRSAASSTRPPGTGPRTPSTARAPGRAWAAEKKAHFALMGAGFGTDIQQISRGAQRCASHLPALSEVGLGERRLGSSAKTADCPVPCRISALPSRWLTKRV